MLKSNMTAPAQPNSITATVVILNYMTKAITVISMSRITPKPSM